MPNGCLEVSMWIYSWYRLSKLPTIVMIIIMMKTCVVLLSDEPKALRKNTKKNKMYAAGHQE